MQDDLYYAYVVEAMGMIVGFATGLIREDLENEGDIYLEGGHMYVAPLYRKGKAGVLLHRMSTEVCRKHGAKIFRRHVPVNNSRMMARLVRKGHIIRENTVDEMMRA